VSDILVLGEAQVRLYDLRVFLIAPCVLLLRAMTDRHNI